MRGELHISAPLSSELRAGVRGPAAARLEAAIVAPFERRGRLVTLSYAAWKESGRVLAELVANPREVTRHHCSR